MTRPETPEQLDWYYNAATGELARPRQLTDDYMLADLWLQPGAAVAGAHTHDHFEETFEVADGSIGVMVGDTDYDLSPGDAKVKVPPGVVHDWRQKGGEISHVLVEIKGVEGAPGSPARRFEQMIEVLFSLGTLGKVNSKGMPDILWLAAIGREYRDVIRFRQPPQAIQTILFGPLAALARRVGRDPRDTSLHGPGAPCRIAELDEQGKAALLAGRAPTRRHD